MTTVRKALALSLAERYLLLVFALATNVLVARLLTPTQIGQYSVVLAAIALMHVLRDFGIGSFLIQQKDLRESHQQTAFGVSLCLGALLCVALVFGAPLVARFYAEPSMTVLMRICALNFLVLPFSTISMSMLRRDMRFDHVARANICSAVVTFAVSIALATHGWGANGLALGSVAGNITVGLVAWWARGQARELLRPSFREWRTVLGFGGQSALANVVTSVAVNINDLAVGKLMGFASVAMISRAQGLMSLFHRDLMGTIRGVAYPAFSRSHREGVNLEAQWRDSVGAVTVFAWPFYGFVSLLSLETLRLLFGPQWDAAAPLVPAFCLAGAVAATSNLIFPLLTASGRVDLVTRAELAYQPLRAAILITVAAWLQSVMAFAISYMVVLSLHTPLAYWVKARHLKTDWAPLMRQFRASLKVTVFTLALPLAWVIMQSPALAEPLPLWQFALLALLALLAWVVGIQCLGHPVKHDPLFRRLMFHKRPFSRGDSK